MNATILFGFNCVSWPHNLAFFNQDSKSIIVLFNLEIAKPIKIGMVEFHYLAIVRNP